MRRHDETASFKTRRQAVAFVPANRTASNGARIADVLESLERRRRVSQAKAPKGRRGDLDLDAIP